jgi:hypothetical protein
MKTEQTNEPVRRTRGKKKGGKDSLGKKNKPFKLHDYCHPSSGFVMTGGAQ